MCVLFRALWTGLIGVVILLVMVTICGLAMYAYFRQCDPFINLNHRKVEKPDQVGEIIKTKYIKGI